MINTTKRAGGKKGFIIELAILLIAVLLISAYFGIDIQKDIVNNPNIQSNFWYLYDLADTVWYSYLRGPVLAIWVWALNNVINLPVGTGNNGIVVPQIPLEMQKLPDNVTSDWNILKNF